MSPRGGRRRGAGKREPRRVGLGRRDPTKRSVWGVSIADDLRDKLVDQMNDLMAEMGEIDPAIEFVYNHHRVAKLLFYGVTVDVDETAGEKNLGGATGSVIVPFDIKASIRVHVAYTTGFMDSRVVTELLQSIDNWLHQHRNLGDNLWIVSTGPTLHREAFEESATQGGEMIVNAQKKQEYAQL